MKNQDKEITTYKVQVRELDSSKQINARNSFGCAPVKDQDYVYCLSLKDVADGKEPDFNGKAAIAQLNIITGKLEKRIALDNKFIYYQPTYVARQSNGDEIILLSKIHKEFLLSIPIEVAISINKDEGKVNWITDLAQDGKFSEITSCSVNSEKQILICSGVPMLEPEEITPTVSTADKDEKQIQEAVDRISVGIDKVRTATFSLTDGKKIVDKTTGKKYEETKFLTTNDGWISQVGASLGVSIQEANEGKDFEVYNFTGEKIKFAHKSRNFSLLPAVVPFAIVAFLA